MWRGRDAGTTTCLPRPRWGMIAHCGRSVLAWRSLPPRGEGSGRPSEGSPREGNVFIFVVFPLFPAGRGRILSHARGFCGPFLTMNPQAKNRTLLVVDDDASVREVLRFVLEHRGYQVLIA